MKKLLFALFTISTSIVTAQTGTTIYKSFESDGVTRSFTYYVPDIYYTANVEVPLILNIHGWTGSSADQEGYTGFREIADTANFIIIHPEALPEASPFGPQNSWDFVGSNGEYGVEDKNYLMNVLDTILANFNINTSRIYSTGFSQGAIMSYDFACFYSWRFAAIASVSAAMRTDRADFCTPVHPMPVMHIHGTNDLLADYNGGESMHVDTLVKYWVDMNNCNPVPAFDSLPNVDTTDNSTVEHYVYSGGDNGSTVEFYKVLNGGHQWPSDSTTTHTYGVGTRNFDFHASTEIWRFFNQYTYVGINENAAAGSVVSVYPNPSSSGVFTVELSNIVSASITVNNVLGEAIYSSAISNGNITIDLSSNAPGVYVYQIVNANGLLGNGKLIIQ